MIVTICMLWQNSFISMLLIVDINYRFSYYIYRAAKGMQQQERLADRVSNIWSDSDVTVANSRINSIEKTAQIDSRRAVTGTEVDTVEYSRLNLVHVPPPPVIYTSLVAARIVLPRCREE